jgi:hypothetical protein
MAMTARAIMRESEDFRARMGCFIFFGGMGFEVGV